MLGPLPFVGFLLCIALATAPYVQQLLEQRPYHIPLALGLAASLYFFVVRWDKHAKLPSHKILIGLVGFLVISAATASFYGWIWSGGVTLLVTLAIILGCQTDKQGQQAAALALVPIALFRLPFQWQMEFNQQLASIVIDLSAGGLDILDLAFFQHRSLIGSFESQLFADSFIEAPMSWPLFAMVAALHSFLLRRSLLIGLFNLAASIVVFVIFASSEIVTTVWLDSMSIDIAAITLELALALVAYALFCSFERAGRVILAPIRDEAGDSRKANPLVHLWNGAGELSQKVQSDPPPVPKAVLASVAVLGLVAASIAVWRVVKQDDPPRDILSSGAVNEIQKIWSPENTTSYRVANTPYRRGRWHQWISLAPDYTSELSISDTSISPISILSSLSNRGWQLVQEPDSSVSEPSNTDTENGVLLKSGEQWLHVISALSPLPDSQSSRQTILLTQYSFEPSVEDKANASELLLAVGSLLNQTKGAN